MPIKPVNVNPVSAMIHRRNIGISNSAFGQNLAKLSSGLRINKASDDSAGLAIAMQLEADIKSSGQAQRNVSDGMSLTRTAEGGLSEISGLLARGRELSVQAANGTLSDAQRGALNKEIQSIQQEVDRITGVTEFNGQQLLSGELSSTAPTQVNVQAGIHNTANDQISLNVIEKTDTASLGIDTVDISTQQGAGNALAAFDTAIGKVNANRARIGSVQNRFDKAASNLAISRENLTAAKTAIQGLDYAGETSSAAANKTLVQAGVQALRQGLQSQAGLIGSLLNTRG